MARTANINIETTGLRDFAGDPRIDLDVTALPGLAAAAKGQSRMIIGSRFHAADHPHAMDAMLAVLEQFKNAIVGGYRPGADAIANAYDTTEEQVNSLVR
jgi:hypothetical protein